MDAIYLIDESNGLYHHGIKGQRWGIRRFQNPDGTLTEAGKRHYSRGFAGRAKERREAALMANTMARGTAKKKADAALKKWEDALDNTPEMTKKEKKKWTELDNKQALATRKAEEYSSNRNKDRKEESRLWNEAYRLQKDADDYYNKTIGKAEDKEERLYNKYSKADDEVERLNDEYKALADDYVGRYGQVELDRLPKTGQDVVDRALDDALEVLSGNMSKRAYNRRYEGTGFVAN